MKRKLIIFLSYFTWLLALVISFILELQGCNPTEYLKAFIIIFSMLITEWKLSFLHEKMHMRMAKHYHPECEYKITNNHFSCNNPKAFSPKEIRIVAASASIVNLLIAVLFIAAGFFLFGIEIAISIITLSLCNLIVSSNSKTTTDGYLIIFPEKFYEVGGF